MLSIAVAAFMAVGYVLCRYSCVPVAFLSRELSAVVRVRPLAASLGCWFVARLPSVLPVVSTLHTGHVPLSTMSVMHAVHSCTLVSVALAPQHGVRPVGPISKHTAYSPSICGIYSVVVISVCSVQLGGRCE